MPRVRVHNFTMSLDGYAAGPDQSLDNPVGVGAGPLHDWVHATRSFHHRFGWDGGEEGLDDVFIAQGDDGIGATIMGRNMFGPIRGPWGGESWRGWWGENPPFHHPVFVLTHHPRPSIVTQGETIFHFVSDGIHAALERALDAADGRDVGVGGGAATIQQYLRAALIDEMHVAVVPILLGSGERLFDNLEGGPAGHACVEFLASSLVMHICLARTETPSTPPALRRTMA